jgi:hypothetical protein
MTGHLEQSEAGHLLPRVPNEMTGPDFPRVAGHDGVNQSSGGLVV